MLHLKPAGLSPSMYAMSGVNFKDSAVKLVFGEALATQLADWGLGEWLGHINMTVPFMALPCRAPV
jgi:hypothetical protein